jgi:serine/threonine protein kinase
VAISDFEFVKPLASGGYGKVHLARKIATGDIYAIKEMSKRVHAQKNSLTNIRTELDVLAEV